MIAHVINNRPIIQAAIFLSLICVSTVNAATKLSDSYAIKQGWYDSENIYIVYEKVHQEVYYSKSDMEGSISKETRETYISKFQRGRLKKGGLIDIADGTAITSIIYQDSDFTVQKNNDEIKLSGRLFHDVELKCSNLIWTRRAPIRFQNQLFACGSMYDESGKSTTGITDSIVREIDTDLKSDRESFKNSTLNPINVVSTISSGKVLFANSILGNSVPSIRMTAFPLIHGTATEKIEVQLPDSNVGYVIQNDVFAYSPNGFLLRPRAYDAQWVLLCTISDCKKIDTKTQYSFLIVDDDSKEIYTLRQRNLTSTAIEVGVVNY